MRFRTAFTAGVLGLALATTGCAGHDDHGTAHGGPSGGTATGGVAPSDMSDGHGGPSGGSSAGPAAGAAGPFNATDVQFAGDMIPHHRQAVEMSDLAATSATHPDVKALAAKIRQAQEPEIAAMSGWLTGWGEPVPSPGAAMHHDMGGMPGMLTDAELRQLRSAGAGFDQQFLTQMIKHHEGAVEMAKTEQVQGESPAAKRLAGTIVTTQTAEITAMRQLLDKLG